VDRFGYAAVLRKRAEDNPGGGEPLVRLVA